MTSKAFITTLPVGQGAGTLVEVWTDNAMTSAALIDLGSWGATKTDYGFPSVEYVVNKLKKMSATNVVLEVVVLTHGDIDHINLIQGLLDNYDTPSAMVPTRPVMTIKRVVYGGAYESYKKYNDQILLRLNEYRPAGAADIYEAVADNVTFYHPDNPCSIPVGDLTLRILVANAISDEPLSAFSDHGTTTGRRSLSKKATGYALNSVSMVVVLDFAGVQYFVTGDATGQTLVQCNAVIESYIKNPRATFPLVVSLTVPHHGSSATLYDLQHSVKAGSDPTADAAKEIKKFVDFVQPKTLTVGAGEVGRYCLPAAQVIGDLSAYVQSGVWQDPQLTDQGDHFFTAYYYAGARNINMDETWPKESGWNTCITSAGVFSNDYFGLKNVTRPSDYIRLSPNPKQSAETIGVTLTSRPAETYAWRFSIVDAQHLEMFPELPTADALALADAGRFPKAIEAQIRAAAAEDDFVAIPSVLPEMKDPVAPHAVRDTNSAGAAATPPLRPRGLRSIF